MNSIVLTGGGTAGHCLPHLAIIPHIHSTFDNIVYIGSKNGIERELMKRYCDYFAITTVKLDRSFNLKNLLIPFLLMKGVSEAKKILKDSNCKLVFSKGGYVSLPVVIAASKLKIPVICHESDYSLGLANTIAAKKCKLVLTSFEKTALTLKNGVFTGPPIREEMFFADRKTAKKKLGFDNAKPILLVMGGSSGSKKINDCLCKCLPKLLAEYYVIHLTGKNNGCEKVAYCGYLPIEYTGDIATVYAAADFAVSRAGANAASELIAMHIPTLFIPLSKAVSRGDQIQNAEYFCNKQLCRVLNEECLNESSLLAEIDKLHLNGKRLSKNLFEYKFSCGNEKIAEIILNNANS